MKTKKICLVVSLFALAVCSIYAQDAKKILEKSGIEKGNCLVVDSSEILSLDLAGKSKLRIYLICNDQKKVDAMRLKIDKAGKYGQVTCRREVLNSILYPTYFFDLVMINTLDLNADTFAEAYRLIKPGKVGVFIGKDIEPILKKADAPCVKTIETEKDGNMTILKKGYEHTNKYLNPPLTRLWVTSASQEKYGSFYNRGIIELMKGTKGEIVRENCMNNVPLDPYTGMILVREPKYQKSDYEQDPKPYNYRSSIREGNFKWGRHHGRHEARDRKTGELVWTFFDQYLFCGSCSNPHYANGVVYKSVYASIFALDAYTGRLLWHHRDGGHNCSSVLAARSILYEPDEVFRMHAFISDTGWEKHIPKGDVLERGTDTSTLRTPDSELRTSSDWPMFHHDACRTGYSPDGSIKPPLKPLWKYNTGNRVRSSPAVVEGTVYVGSSSHTFHAIDAETGRERWRFFTDGEIHSSPCVWGSAVYFGCDDGRIYALDRKTGKLCWIYKTATTAPLTPVYGACLNDDPKKAVEWEETIKRSEEMRKAYSPSRSLSPLCFNGIPLSGPGAVRSSPVVANGILYVGTGLGEDAAPCWGFLYALDAASGTLLWKDGEEEISERGEKAFGVANSPCFLDGKIHFSYATYTAVDAEKGTLLLKGGILPKGRSYMRQEKLPASFKKPDGTNVRYVMWSLYFPGAQCTVRGDIAIDRKSRIAFAVTGQHLFAMDAVSGEVKWEGRYGERDTWGIVYRNGAKTEKKSGNINFHHPVAVGNRNVYLGGGKGIAVFDLQTGGKEKAEGKLYYNKDRRVPWGESVFKPMQELKGPEDFVMTAPAIANGFLFAGADDGCVYAWDLKSGEVAWKHKTGGKVRSSPAVARGKLYIGSDDGYVYCFGNQQ